MKKNSSKFKFKIPNKLEMAHLYRNALKLKNKNLAFKKIRLKILRACFFLNFLYI